MPTILFFYRIRLNFISDFGITILNIKVPANYGFKMVTDKLVNYKLYLFTGAVN